MEKPKSLNLSPKAREMRNEYQRKWRKRNPESVRAAAEKYWNECAEKNIMPGENDN